MIISKWEQIQSIDSYMQGLEKLAQGCKFEAVDAEQYMRDAFINGISSAFIKDFLKTKNWVWQMYINKPGHSSRPQNNLLHMTAIVYLQLKHFV